MIIEGEKSGLIHAAEREMIEGVLDLTDRAVRTIMTPRPEVTWINLEHSQDAILKTIGNVPTLSSWYATARSTSSSASCASRTS